MRKATLLLLGLAGMLCVGSGQARLLERGQARLPERGQARLLERGQARLLERGQARMSDFAAHQALMDSLSRVHPRLRGRWLNERGLEMPGINAPLPVSPLSDSGGLRLVGKWGRGPSVEVTGRDSLVFLSLGSQVAIINFADPDNPEVLSEPQAMGLVTQAAVRDSFLYIGARTGRAGIEVWNIADPRNPVLRSRTPTLLSDFCIRDTLLYLTQSLSGPNDTFKIYSIADPGNPRLLGACRDSGDAVTVTSNAAFLADRWGLYALDVSDPANPRRVGSYPGVPISVEGRGNILCVTFMDPNRPDWLRFEVLDVTDPANMRRLGYLDDTGGYDIFLAESLAFLSGYYAGEHGFRIIDVSDSTRPVTVCSRPTPGAWGVWASLQADAAYLADRTNGLIPVNIETIGHPVFGPEVLATCETQDISVRSSYAFLANLGLKVLDVSQPHTPREVGNIDTGHRSKSIAVDDSFAFAEWRVTYNLASLDITDPTTPLMAGGCMVVNPPEAMVLRDSLLYVAQHYRFQVVNVARPREPVVVGTCDMGSHNWGVTLQDTFAYVGSWSGLIIVNVADPTAPRVVSTTGGTRTSTWGVAVQDTFVFVPSGYETLWVYSAADPVAPYPIAGVPLGQGNWGYDAVMVGDSLVFVGCRQGVVLVDVSDRHDPAVVGRHPTPAWVRRVTYASPYLYAACWDGGVAVFETSGVGIKEPQDPCGKTADRLEVFPTLARDWVRVRPLLGLHRGELLVVDIAGRPVGRAAVAPGHPEYRLDIRSLSPGLYFVVARAEDRFERGRFIKP